MAKPKNCISVSEAKSLQQNWRTSRNLGIENAIGEVDASDFTFSLAEIEEYVAYVKEQSNKLGIDNPGIRIYFAANNERDNNKATVFLAPTVSNTSRSENNYEIDPFNKGQGGWPPNEY